MSRKQTLGFKMRIIHRYLGFFLAGIMAMYALSGITLIFRDSDFLKKEEHLTKQIKPNASPAELGKLLGFRNVKITKEDPDKIYFSNGFYEKQSGVAEYDVKDLPYFLKRMTQLHKSSSSDPLFFLNVFFGISLLFFVLSAFWMFMPQTSVFKKGMLFTVAGVILTIVLLLV